MITITLWLMETSEPLVYDDVKTTYTKGPLFCLHLSSDKVVKYPLCNIFRIEQEYGKHGKR